WSDSDWANVEESRKSASGNLPLLGISFTAWTSTQQGPNTLSNSEAGWAAMLQGMRHSLHIYGVYGELRLPQDETPWASGNHGVIRAGRGAHR
ncbi:unnamed protein product, partial [Sphacelaria rigidula]